MRVRTLFFLFAGSLPNAILTTTIIYMINSALFLKKEFFASSSLVFLSVVLVSLLLNVLFQRRLIELSNRLIYENEINILKALRAAALTDLEKIGKEKIYGILEDLRTLVFIPYVIYNGVTALVIFLIGAVYFVYTSYVAAALFFIVVSLFIIVYLIYNRTIIANSENSRNFNDNYFQLIRDLLEGFKELKINQIKQLNLLDKHLFPNRAAAEKMETVVSKAFMITNLMSQYGLYFIIGLVIFVFPELGFIEKDRVGSFVVIILFISGPITTFFSLQGYFTRIVVANKRITDFLGSLRTRDIPHTVTNRPINFGDFNKIRFQDVVYEYANSSFKLNSINLEITRGELIFIVGGNGSGKTTFINLLTNLYPPTEGALLVDDQVVKHEDICYRNLISVIFSDSFLFSRNYDNCSLSKNNAEYSRLVSMMELDQLAPNEDDIVFRKGLSRGQRKRMAMILALLEQRPILVLDEWAADQDPYFRKYFYENLLPHLKKSGKTIIAVTHDDSYYAIPDRILEFNGGKLVKNTKFK